MDPSASIGLAASCADLVGAAGSSSVKLNHFLRIYREPPEELRLLQARAASVKQTLDRLLALLDRDQPAFQHPHDVEALELHLNAISFLVKNIQDRSAKLEQARSTPFPNWSSVVHLWGNEDIREAEARLGRQLAALTVYLDVSRPDDEAQQLVQIKDANQRACLLAAWDDTATYLPIPESPSENASSPSTSLPPNYQATSNSSVGLTAQNSIPSSEQAYRRPQSSISAVSSSTSSPIATSMGQTSLAPPPKDHHWSQTLRNQGIFMPSARRLKSMAMLQKPPSPYPIRDMVGQGDDLHLAEFKSRVSEYAQGISPVWELTAVPKKKKKEMKQRYRNRFTRSPSDDLSPDKLQSQFKIIEKGLWDAILHKENKGVHDIMNHRFSDNLVVEKRDRITALHLAASLGVCNIVQTLVTYGANPNYADRYGATPLHYAADFGCASCIDILVSAGAKVDLEAPKTAVKTPLFYAAKRGNLDAANTLLNLGAHIYTLAAGPRDTILYAAIESGNLQLCKMLLHNGANPQESFDVLWLATSTSKEILAHLVSVGADPNLRDADQQTILHKYLLKSDPEMVAFLLKLGAKPGMAAEDLGRMTLHLALDKGGSPDAPALLKALLEGGDDPNQGDTWGQTPLHCAVLWGRADAAELLCKHGADIYMRDKKNSSPWSETNLPGYEKRTGTNSFSDFPGTKAVIDRWHQGQSTKAPLIPEADSRQKSIRRTELHSESKPVSELDSQKVKPALAELSGAPRPAQELDAEPMVRRKPVVAELPS
ncbi:uncharacterized protein JN550_001994 [Neoarthrinium moseri]|uniref:uncharacterized protein n=1 Tax=Neoarthrinium moseri TaxID=1658444 RepID=UPI001FDDF74A|nr:uncharacterized protein JN550_001994 [Neoarthrinium moseri]KAI1875708.1 hypothetical protein JN550_001994 [Neoarthrinium moseri]